MSLVARALVLVFVSLGWFACPQASSQPDASPSSDAGPEVAADAGVPRLSVSSAPTELSLKQGEQATATITTSRLDGYAGAVSLSVGSLPLGVAAELHLLGDSVATTTSELRVSASSSAALGVVPITITATGAGVVAYTVVSVTITEPNTPFPPAFSLTVESPSVTLAPGGEQSRTLTLARTNFTELVTLAATNLPQGVTATFNPSMSLGTQSVVTLQASSSAPPGSYTVGIEATSSLAPRHTELALEVLAPGSFSLNAGPSMVTVDPGQSTQVGVEITRSGFTGAVTLSLQGAPPGVTAAFTPQPATETSATLSLQVASTVPAGVYALDVVGEGVGATTQRTPLRLTVAQLGVGRFTLASTPSALTVVQGAQGSLVVSVLREGGFGGAVTLSVTGAPQGVTATPSPPLVSGSAGAIIVDVSPTATLGPATLVVRGAAPPLAPQTVEVSLTVAAPPPGITFDFTQCDAARRPLWFAWWDANHDWLRVTPDEQRYTFDLLTPKGGIALVTGSADAGFVTEVFLRSADEFRVMASAWCRVLPHSGVSARGTLVNTNSATVSIGGQPATLDATDAGRWSWQASDLPSGPVDLVALVNTETEPTLLIRRSLVPDGGVFAAFDPLGSEAITPTYSHVTVDNATGQETLSRALTVHTQSSCRPAVLSLEHWADAGTFLEHGIPSNRIQTTDFHALTVNARTPTTERSLVSWSHTFPDISVSLPELPVAPNLTQTSAGYRLVSFAWLAPSVYDRETSASYSVGSNRFTISQSFGFAETTNFALSAPNFSALGYQNAWGPALTGELKWRTTHEGARFAPCVSNAQTVSASRSGSVP